MRGILDSVWSIIISCGDKKLALPFNIPGNTSLDVPGAYLLITAMPGSERSLVDQIANIPGVISVEGVYGDFDLIARVEVPVGNSIGPIIDTVRKLTGIKSTKTVSTIDGERKSGTAVEYHGAPSD